MKPLRLLINKFILVFIFILFNGSLALASTEFEFGPNNGKINGSIKYSMIGRYKAIFEEFNGQIVFNEELESIESVYLEIQVDSIKSNCKWCDKFVRSKRLLDTENYTKITFKSKEINRLGSAYKVKGILRMKGIEKELTFPFNISRFVREENSDSGMIIQGKWKINRKHFKIIWNKILDRGGIIVGNHITVDWKITRFIFDDKALY